MRLATPARAELVEAAQWYEDRRAGLGGDFIDAVEAAAERLADWPDAGTPVQVGGHGYRRVGVSGFPYHLPYRVTEDEVQVLAVAHDRRQPGYWSGR